MGLFDRIFGKKDIAGQTTVNTFLKPKDVPTQTNKDNKEMPDLGGATGKTVSFESSMNQFYKNQKEKKPNQLSDIQRNTIEERVSGGKVGMGELAYIDKVYGTDYSRRMDPNRGILKSTLDGASGLFAQGAMLLSSDSEEKEKADAYISEMAYTKDKEMTLSEWDKREEVRRNKSAEAESKIALADEIEQALIITSNREIYPAELVTKSIELLTKNKIPLDPEAVKSQLNYIKQEAKIVQDEVAREELLDSRELVGVFGNKEAANQYALEKVLPVMAIPDEEKGTAEGQYRFNAKRAFFKELINEFSADAEDLYKMGAIESPQEYFNDGVPSVYLRESMAALDDFYNKTNAGQAYLDPATGVFNQKQFIEDAFKSGQLGKISKEYGIALQQKKLDELSWEKGRGIYTNFVKIAKYPTASLSMGLGGGSNIEEAAKDIYQPGRQKTFRNSVREPFVKEAGFFDAAILIISGKAMISGPLKLQRMVTQIPAIGPRIAQLFNSNSFGARVGQFGVRASSEIASSIPFDLVLNGFIPEEEVDWKVDAAFNAAGGLFGQKLAAIDELYFFMKSNMEKGMPAANIAEKVRERFQVNVPEVALESAEKAREFIGDMINTFKGGKNKQAEIVARSISASAANATDEKLLALQKQLKDIQNSKIFTEGQKKVNDNILGGVINAKTPEEVRSAFIKFGEVYDVKQYEKFIDFKYKDVASSNLIDNIGEKINSGLKADGINVPEDFGYKIALATFLDPKYMSNKSNMLSLVKSNGGEAIGELIERNIDAGKIIIDGIAEVQKGKKVIEAPNFTDTVIKKAQQAAAEYEKNQKSSSLIKGTITRQKAVDNVISKIHSSRGLELDKIIKGAKTPEGKMNALKDAVFKRMRSEGIDTSNADSYSQILAPAYMQKYINNPKDFDVETSFGYLDGLKLQEIFNDLIEKSIPREDQVKTLESFLTDVVKKIYGDNQAGVRVLDGIQSFLKTYNANKTLLINAGVDDAVDGFLVQLPSEGARQFVIGLGGNLLDESSKLLSKNVLSNAEKATLSNTLGVVMHEVGHIALESIPVTFKDKIVNTFKKVLFSSGEIDIDTLGKILGGVDKPRYMKMVTDKQSQEYIVNEFLSDYIGDNLSSYVFNKDMYEDGIKILLEKIGVDKMQDLMLGLGDVDDVIVNAGEYIKGVIAMAYLTNPKKKSFSKFIKQLDEATVVGDVDLTAITKDPQVFFKEPSTVTDGDLLEFYNQEFSENIGEGYFRALLHGQGGVTKLKTIVGAISKGIKSGNVDNIFVDMAYLSPSGQLILQKYFNTSSMAPDKIELFNKIMDQSKKKQLNAAFGLASRIVDSLYNFSKNVFSLKNIDTNITNIAAKTASILSDNGVTTRSSQFIGGIEFAPLLTLTKYLGIGDRQKMSSLMADTIDEYITQNPDIPGNTLAKQRFGGEVGKKWMEMYNKIYDQLLDLGMDEDAIADVIHPLIFSAEEYLGAFVKSNVLDEDAVGAMIGLLKKRSHTGVLNAVEGIEGVIKNFDSIDDNMIKGGNIAAKNLGTTRLEKALSNTIDLIEDQTKLDFVISDDKLNEYLYKMYYQNFGAVDNSSTIIENVTNTIFKSVDNSQLSDEAYNNVRNILRDISTFSSLVKKGATSKNLDFFDELGKSIKKLSDAVSNLPFKTDMEKMFSDGLVETMANDLGKGGVTFQDVARNSLIKNIKGLPDYNNLVAEEIAGQTDNMLLEAAVQKEELFKKRISADKAIFKESLKPMLSEATDESFDKISNSVKNLAQEVGLGEDVEVSEYSSITRSIMGMLEGKRGVRTILQNEDTLKIFNDEIVKQFGGAGDDAAYYFNFYKDTRGRIGTKTKFDAPVASGWAFLNSGSKRYGFNFYRMARAIMSEDPESSYILAMIDKNKRDIKFRNTKAVAGKNSYNSYEYFNEAGLKLREIAKTMKFSDVREAREAALTNYSNEYRKGIENKEVLDSFSDKKKNVYNHVINMLSDISNFRRNGNLGDIPLTIMNDTTIKGVDNVGNMINRLGGPWNYISGEDISSLTKKYGSGHGEIKGFTKNILFGGVRDYGNWYAVWDNSKVTQLLRSIFFMKNYNPLAYPRFVNDVTVNIIDAESTLKSVSYIDPRILDEITNVVGDYIDFHLIGSGKMGELAVEQALDGIGQFQEALSKINVLYRADKTALPKAMRMAVAVGLYDMVGTYGAKAGYTAGGESVDIITHFLNRIKSFEDFKKLSKIDEYYFATRNTPTGKIAKYAKENGISTSEVFDEYNKQMNFFHNQYNPFLSKSKTALTTFYAFDNTPEFGAIAAVQQAPRFFGLMKWATTKSSEFGYAFYKEIKDNGAKGFLKKVINGESKAANKYASLTLLAARAAHATDRLTGGEEDRTKIAMTYMAPVIAVSMGIVGQVISAGNEGIRYSNAGLGGFWGTFAQSLSDSLLRRALIYQTGIASSILDISGAGANADGNKFKAVFNAFLYDAVERLLTNPYVERYAGIDFKIPNYDGDDFIKRNILGLKYESEQARELRMASKSVWMASSQNQEGTDIISIVSKFPVIGQIIRSFQFASGAQRNAHAKLLYDYMVEKKFDTLFDGYINKDILGEFIDTFDANSIGAIYTSNGKSVPANMTEDELIADMLKNGYLTSDGKYSYSTKSILEPLLLASGAGNNMSELSILQITPEKELYYAEVLDLIGSIAKKPGARRPTDTNIRKYLAASNDLGTSYATAELIDALFVYNWKQIQNEMVSKDSTIKNYLSYQTEEGEGIMKAFKDDGLGEYARGLYVEAIKKNRQFQEDVLKEFRPVLAREDAAPINFLKDYMNVDPNSPMDMRRKMDNPASALAQYSLLQIMDFALDSNGEPNTLMTIQNSIALDASQTATSLSKKESETEEEFNVRVINSFGAFKNLMESINLGNSSPAAKEQAKSHIGVAMYPFIDSLSNMLGEEFYKVNEIIGEGDPQTGLDRIGSALDQLSDAESIDAEYAAQIATDTFIGGNGGGKGSKPKTKTQKEFEIAAIKAKNAVAELIGRLQTIRFNDLPPLRYENRKRAGSRPTKISFKPDREKFAREYRSAAIDTVRPKPIDTPPLPVKSSRVIGGKVRVGNIRNSKVYSKQFRI